MKLTDDRCYSCEYGSWHTENDVLQYGCDYGCDAADCNYRKKKQTVLTIADGKYTNDIRVDTSATIHHYVGGVSNYETSHYFNCKRCGAVGQSGVCEYCGSVEE